MRILLLEDELALRQNLAEHLRQAGHVVDEAGDGEEGLYIGNEFPIDVAVVDLGLPKLDGGQVIRNWRERGRAFPVLILTARGRWQDKVEGLEAGADDYLAKPFHLQELVARVNALWRRASGWSQPVLRCGPLELDSRQQTVSRGGQPIELTSFEYRLLEYLMVRAGEVIAKAALAEHLYQEDLERDSNVIEVLVARLRRKLDPDATLNPIETLRGRGYRLALPRVGQDE